MRAISALQRAFAAYFNFRTYFRLNDRRPSFDLGNLVLVRAAQVRSFRNRILGIGTPSLLVDFARVKPK